MNKVERVERHGLRVGDQITQVVSKDIARIMRRAARKENLHNFMVLDREGQTFTSQMGNSVKVPKGFVRLSLGYNGITDLSGFDRRVNEALAKRGMKTTPLTR